MNRLIITAYVNGEYNCSFLFLIKKLLSPNLGLSAYIVFKIKIIQVE